MAGKTFEVGTDEGSIEPRPNGIEIQEIIYAAYVEATSLPDMHKAEVGRYLGQLSKSLLKKEG